jgi:hypothetical protein
MVGSCEHNDNASSFIKGIHDIKISLNQYKYLINDTNNAVVSLDVKIPPPEGKNIKHRSELLYKIFFSYCILLYSLNRCNHNTVPIIQGRMQPQAATSEKEENFLIT